VFTLFGGEPFAIAVFYRRKQENRSVRIAAFSLTPSLPRASNPSLQKMKTEDTPQDMQDGSLIPSETSNLDSPPLERRRLEYEELTSMNLQQDDEDEDEWTQQQIQREKEEVLYSLYESHNTPAQLPPTVTPGRKMVHLIDQALHNNHNTTSKSSLYATATSGRRSKYSKSMPNLHLASSVSRFIDSWNPYGGESMRSKSCSNVEAYNNDSLSIVDESEGDASNHKTVATPSAKHTLASFTNAIHVSPSFHIKQQQRANWMPGVTYLPILLVQYMCHPFYALWKNLLTDDSVHPESSAAVASPNGEDATVEYFVMMGSTEEEMENNEMMNSPVDHHPHRHHHRRHHHHHRHHSNEELKHDREEENQQLRGVWGYVPLSSTQKTSTPSYVAGGDLFVE
jgi:hypothetical protein